jgi:hypothetical protein
MRSSTFQRIKRRPFPKKIKVKKVKRVKRVRRMRGMSHKFMRLLSWKRKS